MGPPSPSRASPLPAHPRRPPAHATVIEPDLCHLVAAPPSPCRSRGGGPVPPSSHRCRLRAESGEVGPSRGRRLRVSSPPLQAVTRQPALPPPPTCVAATAPGCDALASAGASPRQARPLLLEDKQQHRLDPLERSRGGGGEGGHGGGADRREAWRLEGEAGGSREERVRREKRLG